MFRFWDQSPRHKIEQMLERGEAQKAFIELTNIINETSFDPFLLEMRARCAMILQMTSTAIFDLTKLLIFGKLAQIEREHLLAVRSSAYLRIGDYENSLKDGQQAFKSRRYNHNMQLLNELINEARFLISQPNLTEKSILRLLSISPESPIVLHKASIFYLHNKKFDEFDKYSQKLLSHDPTNSEIITKRSTYLMCNANNIDESLRILMNCTDYCQEFRDNLTFLTDFFQSIHNGNFSQIHSLLNKSSEIISTICDKGSKLTQISKFVNMTLLYQQNKLESAYEIVNEITREDPNDINAVICKADILYDSGDYESALEIYQQALQVHSNLFSHENNQRIHKRIALCEHLIEEQKNVSPYQILGIPENSDLNTIQAAYESQISRYQLDNIESLLLKKITQQKLKKIDSSYEILLSQHHVHQKSEENKEKLYSEYFQKGNLNNIYHSSDYNHPFISQRF